MELATGAHIDRFVVEARIRSSVLATVYRLRHLDEGTIHALKVLHLDRPTLQDRILAEGRAQARLRHPNVVAYTDVLDVGGSPGLLMEYVAGPSLDQVIARGRPELDRVEAIVPGILAGVAAAHAAQIVHRDLKPGNILLDIRGGTVVPKIADFGLARLLGAHRASITASGATLSTPNYMSPEQVRNARSADARSDLFALGAILYELVTGLRAFDNDNVFAILSDITGGHWAPVHEVHPDVPPRMVEAIEAAMELDVEDRVSDGVELWSIWAGPEGPDLATAAARPVAVPPEWLDLVAEPEPPVLRTELVPGSPAPVGAELPESVVSTAATAPARRASHGLVALVVGIVLLTVLVAGIRSMRGPAAADAAARVLVEGDALGVRLVGWRGEEPRLDAVPPGSYRVEADHGTGEWIDAGRAIQLFEGDEVTIRCDAGRRTCDW